ncbi:unnamed protein product, partial [Phaeothamnion confervicola]
LAEAATALAGGLIALDAGGQVVWMDDATRQAVNGGLKNLTEAIALQSRAGVRCILTT